MIKKKAQIWVETVIYILIAFVMIGLVLSFVKPKIEELRDKAVVEQSIEIMNNLEKVFSDVVVPGNKRIVEIGIRKGQMKIVPENDSIYFEIESRYTYSEPGEVILVGNLNITTQDRGKFNLITINRDYISQYNLTYQNSEIQKTLTAASVPYKLVVSNEGNENSNKTRINTDLI
jgi:hypothetical protein